VLLAWSGLATCLSLSAYALLVAGSRLPRIGPVPIAAAVSRVDAASFAAVLGGLVIAVGLIRLLLRANGREVSAEEGKQDL
jgi:hypothetical protein